MSDQDRQELIERLDKVEKQVNTGFTESGRKLEDNEITCLVSLIFDAREQLGTFPTAKVYGY